MCESRLTRSSPPIRILTVDDHQVVRVGIITLLLTEPDAGTTTVNAEDFKQGAKIDKASVSRAGAWALCLKFCCAKPLQHASSYVFWKVAVLERSPKKDRRWEGIEMGEARRMCFANA
jgi:hypothetical protein